MYLASRGRLSYTPSVECVVSWTIRETQPVCSENFCLFPITSCSCEKRYQGSPYFSVLQVTESWAGPENEAKSKPQIWVGEVPIFILFELSSVWTLSLFIHRISNLDHVWFWTFVSHQGYSHKVIQTSGPKQVIIIYNYVTDVTDRANHANVGVM